LIGIITQALVQASGYKQFRSKKVNRHSKFPATNIPAKKTEFNVKWSFKVMYFGVNGKAIRD